MIESISLVHELVAKMLATENINIKFVNKLPGGAPAAFSPLVRDLYLLPVVEEQQHIYTGLIVHECGHAVFTNPTKAELDLYPITRLFNAIEDGYQERMMIKKFPGVKKHLFTVFDEFFLKDFSMKNYETPNRMINICNIICYNCKGIKYGKVLPYPSWLKHEHIKFIQQEIELLFINTYVGRYKKYLELLEILNQYEKFTDEEEKMSGPASVKDGDDSGEGDGGESGKGKTEITPDDLAAAKAFKDLEDSFDESDLVDHHSKVEYAPEDHKPVADLSGGITNFENKFIINQLDIKLVRDILRTSTNLTKAREQIKACQKNAQLLYSHFITKKNAINVALTSEHKTGKVDTLKLQTYKWNENIFERKISTTEQQNHAYVVALDWSSSMNGSVHHLFNRICELALFADLADVKLEFILFTTNFDYSYKTLPVITHMFDTSTNHGMDLKDRLAFFHTICNGDLIRKSLCSKNKVTNKNDSINQNGTTIFEAVLYSHELLYNLPHTNKTLIMLNDGDDGDFSNTVVYNGHTITKEHGLTYKNSCSKFINRYFKEQRGHKNICLSWKLKPEKRLVNQTLFDVEFDTNETKDNIFIRELVKHII